MEKRTSNFDLSIRSDTSSENKKIISGYFIVFDEETELYPDYFEKISSNAVGDLKNKDIRALVNHDTSRVLGRTTTGTLKLHADKKGVFGEIEINDKDTDALNLYERVKRGDVTQCSFGFYINGVNETWDDNDVLRVELTDIDLFEVSVVTFPAYEQTSVAARTRLEDAKKEKLVLKKERLKERIKNVKNKNIK